VFAASVREGLNVLDVAGIRPTKVGKLYPPLFPYLLLIPQFLFHILMPVILKVDRKASSSMADDLRKGRKTEIDYLNGEIVELGHKLNVNCPVNEKLVQLIKQAERKEISSIPPEQLLQLTGTSLSIFGLNLLLAIIFAILLLLMFLS